MAAVTSIVKKITPEISHSALKSCFQILKKIKYYGRGKICPLCNACLATFLPYGPKNPFFLKYDTPGGGHRTQGLCPVCESKDRERLLYLFLKTRTKLFTENMSLLHFAPEINIDHRLLKIKNLHYISADVDEHAIDIMETIDVMDIHHEDGSFDAVLCNHVMEHVDDHRKALSEIFRILKPGGWAILQSPVAINLETTYEDITVVDPKEREKEFGQEDHVRIIGRDYLSHLEEAGFTVTLFDWEQHRAEFGGPDNIYGLNLNEKVYYCEKPAEQS